MKGFKVPKAPLFWRVLRSRWCWLWPYLWPKLESCRVDRVLHGNSFGQVTTSIFHKLGMLALPIWMAEYWVWSLRKSNVWLFLRLQILDPAGQIVKARITNLRKIEAVHWQRQLPRSALSTGNGSSFGYRDSHSQHHMLLITLGNNRVCGTLKASINVIRLWHRW